MIKLTIRLNAGQRELLADKVAEAANLAAGALIFGQAVVDRPFSLAAAAWGLAIWAAFIVLALAIRRGRK